MGYLLNMFTTVHGGGVIRLFNLFNLKNQKSTSAIVQMKQFHHEPSMFSELSEINYCSQLVIFASGKEATKEKNPKSRQELRKYVSLAENDCIYSLCKVGEQKFAFVRACANKDGLIDSYHPSFTFIQGNGTLSGDLSLV